MLTIRRSQIEAITQGRMLRFERDLAKHLRAAWPRECDLTGGEEPLLRAVRQMTQLAQRNGYHSEREMTLYGLLVLSLGIGFHSDPQFDWAAASLFNEGIDDPTLRIESLYDELVEYLGAVGGDDSERVVRSLLRVRRYDFANAPAGEGADLIDDLGDMLESFWPEKFAFQEATPTAAMVAAAIDRAQRYGIGGPCGRGVFVTLSYFLGHDFDVDPMHPWAKAVLTDPAIGDGEARGQCLLKAGLERVGQSLVPA